MTWIPKYHGEHDHGNDMTVRGFCAMVQLLVCVTCTTALHYIRVI